MFGFEFAEVEEEFCKASSHMSSSAFENANLNTAWNACAGDADDSAAVVVVVVALALAMLAWALDDCFCFS